MLRDAGCRGTAEHSGSDPKEACPTADPVRSSLSVRRSGSISDSNVRGPETVNLMNLRMMVGDHKPGGRQRYSSGTGTSICASSYAGRH